MTDKKITQLPAAAALTGSELVELVQSGANVQSSTGAIASIGRASDFPAVSLLLHLDGVNGATAYTDSSSYANVMSGTAPLNTSNPKFGSASASFTNQQIACTAAAAGPLDIWNGDFTIEGWIYPTNLTSGPHVILDLSNQLTAGGRIYTQGTDLFVQSFGFTFSGTLDIPNVALNTWQHIALVRYGVSLGLFLNGSPVWQLLSGLQKIVAADLLYIGASYNSGAQGTWFPGFIDEVRITKGLARYVNQFTPPVAAFPNT